jgi:hypothetical protein
MPEKNANRDPISDMHTTSCSIRLSSYIRGRLTKLGLCALALLCIITIWFTQGSGWSSNKAEAHTSVPAANTYIDAVIVMDNVSQISVHDPDGDRFFTAQLFVDLALQGDQIGSVKISSSQSPSKSQSGYHPLMDMDARGKTELKHTLTPAVFGPVEGAERTDVPAYITPALQEAGNMLSKAGTNNKRYVIIVTDAVALSGDQNSCPSSPDDNHRWFCQVQALKEQGITTVLIGFSKPGSEAELQKTKDFIESQGGTVLPVEDGAGVAQRMAAAFTDLLTRIHPTMFFANMQNVPSTVAIDQRDQLTNITFVALGNPGVSLASLTSPGNIETAGKQTQDGAYYHSAPPDSGYWLETISAGSPGGTWKLTPGPIAPESMLVIVVSEAHFTLQNPVPANPESDVSVRFTPARGSVVLRASVTDQGGMPLTSVPFTASPTLSPATFTSDTLPGHDATVVDAILPSITSELIQVGLGKPLTGNIYLAKSFHIQARQELGMPQLTLPTPVDITPGTAIPVSAQGTSTSAGKTQEQLTIYERDPQPASPWQRISSGTNNTAGPFIPTRGCGIAYQLIAVDESSGDLGNQHYDYISYAQGLYSPRLKQEVQAQAAITIVPGWLWFPAQVRSTVTFQSTTCTPQTATLTMGLRGSSTANPSIKLNNGPDYSLVNNTASFTIPANKQKQLLLSATPGACPFSWVKDQPFTIQIIPVAQPQTGSLIETGTWQTTMNCPSLTTNVVHYWYASFGILLAFSILVSQLGQGFHSHLRKPYIDGKIEFESNSPLLLDEEELVKEDVTSAARIPVNLPRERSNTWYLDRVNGAEGIIYSFSREENIFSLLKFSVVANVGGTRIKVRATKNAGGAKTPFQWLSKNPLKPEDSTNEEDSFDEEPIVIENDIIYLDLRVKPEDLY